MKTNKSKKRFVFITTAVALMTALSLLLCGCTEDRATFTKTDMKITLGDYFKQSSAEKFTVCYTSNDMDVLAIRQPYSGFTDGEIGKDTPLDAYAEFLTEVNDVDADVETKNGIVYFVYDQEIEGKSYTYLAAVYSGSSAFWFIQFAVRSDRYDKEYDRIMEYACSVELV